MNLSAEQFSQILQSLQEHPKAQPEATAPTGPQKRRAQRVEHRATIVITYCDAKTSPAYRLLVAQSLTGTHGGSLGTTNGSSLTVVVRNISSRGIGILHPRKLSAGDQFIVRLSRAEGPEVGILCTTAHCHRIHETLFAVGAEFTCLLPLQKTSQLSQTQESEAKRIRDSILT